MGHDIKLYLLAIPTLILQPLQPAGAQALPTLRGYRLGITQREARALRLPCQPMDARLHCDAPDSVHLIFERDTLTDIRVDFGVQPTAAHERWFAVADSLIALYGEPDSVRTTGDPIGQGAAMTSLRAIWGPLTTSKPWGYRYSATDMRADRLASIADFSLEGCLVGGPSAPCARVIKQLGKKPP